MKITKKQIAINKDSDGNDWEDEHSHSLYGASIKNDDAMDCVREVAKLQKATELKSLYEGIHTQKVIDDVKPRKHL